MKITSNYNPAPFGTTQYDWVSISEDYLYPGVIGYGKTKEESVLDLECKVSHHLAQWDRQEEQAAKRHDEWEYQLRVMEGM